MLINVINQENVNDVKTKNLNIPFFERRKNDALWNMKNRK